MISSSPPLTPTPYPTPTNKKIQSELKFYFNKFLSSTKNTLKNAVDPSILSAVPTFQ